LNCSFRVIVRWTGGVMTMGCGTILKETPMSLRCDFLCFDVMGNSVRPFGGGDRKNRGGSVQFRHAPEVAAFEIFSQCVERKLTIWIIC